MKVLITGGAGFVGTRLAQALLARGTLDGRRIEQLVLADLAPPRAALLAGMLSLARLFNDDLADGTLEQLLISPHSLTMLVLGKVLAHWAGSGLLVTLAAPVIALQYGLSAGATGVLVVSLLLGTPILSLLGAVTAALTVGLRGGAMLLALLVMPLCVPVLVFGAGAVQAFEAGQGVVAHLSLLGAGLLLSLAFAPLACAQALRISLEA
jgi:heme exporter protein B